MRESYIRFNEALDELMELCGRQLFKDIDAMDSDGIEAIKITINLKKAVNEMMEQEIRLYERLDKFLDRFDETMEKHGT